MHLWKERFAAIVDVDALRCPPWAVSRDLRDEVGHLDLRTVFRRQPGKAVGAVSPALGAGDLDHNVQIGAQLHGRERRVNTDLVESVEVAESEAHQRDDHRRADRDLEASEFEVEAVKALQLLGAALLVVALGSMKGRKVLIGHGASLH